MSSSWSEGVRAAQEAEQRRGRLVGKDADDVRTFAEGSGTCVSCGTEGSAGLMMRGPDGLVCEACHFTAENEGKVGRSWTWAAAGAVGTTALGWALFGLFLWALLNVPPPVVSEVPEFSTFWSAEQVGPLQYPLLTGGLFGLGMFLGWPLFRLIRREASLHGLSQRAHRALSGVGVTSVVLCTAGFFASILGALALLLAAP